MVLIISRLALSSSASGWVFRLVADPRMEASWRAQVMGDGGQQGRAQPVGFRRQPRPVDVAGQADSLDGKCGLIAEGFQQALLIGAEQRTLPLGLEADDRRHPAAGVHGKEKPARPAMGLALPARGAVAGPAPAGGGEIGLAQAAGRRVSGQKIGSPVSAGAARPRDFSIRAM